MKAFFNTHFFIGCVVGGALTLVGLFVIAVGVGWMMQDRIDKGRGGFGLQAPPVPALVEGSMDWEVQTLDGESLPMSECEGSVVFLNFWATWCGPCKEEMPGIQGLYDAVKDTGVKFVCVTQEEAPKVRTFLGRYGYTFPIYTMKGKPPKAFESRGIPATFIVDRSGAIVFKHVGSARWDDESCIRYLRSLAGPADPVDSGPEGK